VAAKTQAAPGRSLFVWRTSRTIRSSRAFIARAAITRTTDAPITRSGGASAGPPSVGTGIGTAAAHLVELLLLLEGEDLPKLFANVGVELVQLPALFIG
jgi:hypothetical protein